MQSVGEDEEPPQPSVWRYVRASRAHVIVDGAAYFELVRDAMLNARQRIFFISWDFDTRVRLRGGRHWWNLRRRAQFPARLGAFVAWLVKQRPGLEVNLLNWNFGALRFLTRGSMLTDLVRWFFNPSIRFKFDSAHPFGCSHHQKIIVMDDCLAVCGGIDMAGRRWDTRAHLDGDTRRRRPDEEATYGPWHDVTMMMEGEVAGALAELGRERWRQSGAGLLPPCAEQKESPWPEPLAAEFRDVEIGIARTKAHYRGVSEIREVEALFLEHIARARRFIYAETQYFASRRIAEAIAARLAEPDPPEIVLINPLLSDGRLEQIAMDLPRSRLFSALTEVDHARRFRIFVPLTAGGTPIYVHSKLMIVDDEILRIGSANMNNRSMGMDTEADVFLDAARPGNGHIVPAIRRLRHSLLAEHCGLDIEKVAEMLDLHGSMARMIDNAPKQGKRLDPFAPRPLANREKALADSDLLDPERPEERFRLLGRRRLFRRGGFLRQPR